MSAIKDGRYPVELNGKEYHLLFSLNALDAVQDKFGGYDQLDKVFKQDNPTMIKDLRWLLTLLINEGRDDNEPELTEEKVGRIIHTGNLGTVQNAIFAAFAYGANGGEEPDNEGTADNEDSADDEGNTQGAQES